MLRWPAVTWIKHSRLIQFSRTCTDWTVTILSTVIIKFPSLFQRRSFWKTIGKKTEHKNLPIILWKIPCQHFGNGLLFFPSGDHEYPHFKENHLSLWYHGAKCWSKEILIGSRSGGIHIHIIFLLGYMLVESWLGTHIIAATWFGLVARPESARYWSTTATTAEFIGILPDMHWYDNFFLINIT